MNNSLNEACAILDEFEKELVEIRAIWEEMEDTPLFFEELPHASWSEQYYKLWLHGATKVSERNELGKWLYDSPPITSTANASAQEIHDAWCDWLQKSGVPKFNFKYEYEKKSHSYHKVPSQELGQMYYAEDDRFAIEDPCEDETLLAFINRLAKESEKRGKGHPLHWRALRSFLDFIRDHYPKEEVAFIENIFPQKMDLEDGRIRRLITPEAFPIPEKTAAEILIEFARRCRNGRPDARHTAAEGLSLCCLCIASSRIRLPKTLERVRNISAKAILSGAEFSISKVPTFGSGCSTSDGDFSVLQVPTWFGEQPLKISNRIAAFLRAVSHIPSKKPRVTILQRPLRTLTRVFDEVLQAVGPNPKYGNITYLSLLQQPHIFGDHRPQPNTLVPK